MTRERLGTVVECIRALADEGRGAGCSDGQLLERFTARREEAAFAALMKRHGPMVLAVCRRVTRQLQDAEDAFQATFMLLARKAGAIRRQESVASWLHGVAYRTALKARRAVIRREQREKKAARRVEPALAKAAASELQAQLDEALQSLPDKYRAAIVLCYFEGRTIEEAARALACPVGTAASRLAQGRELLRRRLTRRGLVLSTTALTTLLLGGAATGGVSPALGRSTLQAGLHFAAGKTPGSLVSAPVAGLVMGGLCDMFLSKLRTIALAILALGGMVAGSGVVFHQDPDPAPQARNPAAKAAAKPSVETPARSDQVGDPLPDSAMARLGTLRFRSPGHVLFLAFTPGAKSLVSQGHDGIRVWDRGTGKELKHLPALAGNYIDHGDLSPDGTTVAAVDRNTGVLGLWDLASGSQLRTFGKSRSARLSRFAPDGKSFLTMANNDASLTLWDVTTGKMLWQVKEGSHYIAATDFSRHGKTLVTCDNEVICVWDAATGQQRRKIAVAPKSVTRIALSPDGNLLASSGEIRKMVGANSFMIRPENVIRLWDIGSGKEVRQLVGPKGTDAEEIRGFTDFLFAPDGQTLVTSGHAALRIWDPATGKELRQIPLDCYASWGLAFSRDGKMLATAAASRTIRLFDAESGKDLAPPVGHQQSVSLALSPTARHLATIGGDRLLQVWDPTSGRLRRRLEGHTGYVRNICLVEKGRTLFSVGEDKTVCVWDLKTGKELRRFQVDAPANWESVAATPDGRTMAWTNQKSVMILDGNTGKEIRRLNGHEPFALGVAFIEKGKKVAVWSMDHKLHLWDAASGRKLLQCPFPQDRGPPRSPPTAGEGFSSYTVAISPDDRLVAYGTQAGAQGPGGQRLSWDRCLALMELATGREIARFTNLPDGPCPMAFAPDGRTLAWGGWQDSPVHLMETATGKERRRLLGHKGRVISLAYSADGNMLVSGSTDTTALVWDLAGRHQTGKPAPLSARELDACWADLAADDAGRAYQAIRKLARDAERAVPFLDKRLQPVPHVTDEQLARLTTALDSKTFSIREQATRELEKLGEVATAACRQALKANTSIEVRRRLERLLEKHKELWQNPPADLLRTLRAVETLELAATAHARKTLARMSQGAPAARVTADAKLSLERLP